MGSGAAVRTVLVEKYAIFQGRASRSEYWWFFLFLVIVEVVVGIVDLQVIGREVLSSLVALATVIPSLAVGARRLHDTDRSGWWQLLHFLPLIGSIVLLIFWIQSGHPDANRFGPPPAS